jgi:AraC family transcriptional regulator, regulatory protein of adaptative response / methylated-DNA-[protein]-cysteine methyltransferase
MDELIVFSTARCALGLVLAAKSERGLCALLLGDAAATLVRDLRQRFPAADLREDGITLQELLEKVKAFLANPEAALDVPLDLRGSEFEQRVWRALQEIPAGAVETYGEVARRLGVPRAAKEVGEACAANALAVAIPCHRVVRKDGGLAGYRWGVRRKRVLLAMERHELV